MFKARLCIHYLTDIHTPSPIYTHTHTELTTLKALWQRKARKPVTAVKPHYALVEAASSWGQTITTHKHKPPSASQTPPSLSLGEPWSGGWGCEPETERFDLLDRQEKMGWSEWTALSPPSTSLLLVCVCANCSLLLVCVCSLPTDGLNASQIPFAD